MDGMLSQDEINALLNGGMDSMGGDDSPADTASADDMSMDENLLSEIERDAIGEVANISMGSSATTLFSLVNQKVNITTPVVSLARWGNVLSEYERPCVFIQIKYTVGLDGSNILILKEHDVKVITDLMMGGDGSNTDGELGELHLSAISEAMNQMMGSAATSLSTMLGKMIDISPPEASLVDLTEFKEGSEIAEFLAGTFVKIAFRMQISDLVDSTIMQLYPVEFAKELCSTFLGSQLGEDVPAAAEPAPAPAPAPAAPQMDMSQTQAGMPQMGMPQMDMSQMQAGMPQMGMPQMDMSQMQMGMPQMGMPQMQMGMPQMGMPQMMPQMQMQPNMSIQPAQFQNFAGGFNPMQPQENIDLIKDVPLEVTVELGRTSKSISDILDFAPGTIIELDKIAGEPIDVLVNGKFVAKGEVVVIEESFGVRVTEIVK
ncbi:MAG: flagellar motor switch phosphatase FliY [Blautia sp.]|nr:flagellar motor switch phosphatase FliY [Blautia sp.]MCM1201178.1 flagellar motor switch phosphatase FliY [Bacteroides fragilis]